MKLSEVRKLWNDYVRDEINGKLNNNFTVNYLGAFVTDDVDGIDSNEYVVLYQAKERSKRYLFAFQPPYKILGYWEVN